MFQTTNEKLTPPDFKQLDFRLTSFANLCGIRNNSRKKIQIDYMHYISCKAMPPRAPRYKSVFIYRIHASCPTCRSKAQHFRRLSKIPTSSASCAKFLMSGCRGQIWGNLSPTLPRSCNRSNSSFQWTAERRHSTLPTWKVLQDVTGEATDLWYNLKTTNLGGSQLYLMCTLYQIWLNKVYQIDTIWYNLNKDLNLVGGFNPLERYESQLGWWNSYGNIENVPNHQPAIYFHCSPRPKEATSASGVLVLWCGVDPEIRQNPIFSREIMGLVPRKI